MSSALRIAAVTHVLKDLLNDGLINSDIDNSLTSEVTVSSLCPGQVDNGGSNTPTQLNLFLYRVSPNVGWSNMAYPSRNARGEAIRNPPLALNLHYLLTAFGENELHAEILMGYGMQLLHETPVLSRQAINQSLQGAAVNGAVPDSLQNLISSQLADQMEQITISPEPTNTEEISRLWTAFQTRYRPCTAYVATVVLIESERATRPTLPVKQHRVFAIPFRQPVLEKVLSQSGSGGASNPISAYRRITLSDRIYLRGYALKNEGVFVRLNGTRIDPEPENISPTEISFELPVSLASELRSGVQGIEVVQPLLLSQPPIIADGVGISPEVTDQPDLDRGEAISNVQAFVLSATIAETSGNPIARNGDGAVELNLDVQPNIYYQQRVVVLLNQINIVAGSTARAYAQVFSTSDIVDADGLPDPVGIDNFTTTIPNVASGDYLLRIQVDGAESPLETAADGTFNGPLITVS